MGKLPLMRIVIAWRICQWHFWQLLMSWVTSSMKWLFNCQILTNYSAFDLKLVIDFEYSLEIMVRSFLIVFLNRGYSKRFKLLLKRIRFFNLTNDYTIKAEKSSLQSQRQKLMNKSNVMERLGVNSTQSNRPGMSPGEFSNKIYEVWLEYEPKKNSAVVHRNFWLIFNRFSKFFHRAR